MNRFAKTDLEGCMKELAERLRHDLQDMSLEKNEYFLCRSIEHLIRVNTFNAATAVIDITHHRQKRRAIRAFPLRSGDDTLTFRQFR